MSTEANRLSERDLRNRPPAVAGNMQETRRGSGPDCPDATALDPELARVVAAWPKLPEPVRAGILAMVQAAGKQAENR